MVLLDLVQQSPVANFQQPGRGFTIPAGLIERAGNRIALGFALYALDQGFQPEMLGRGSAIANSNPPFSAVGDR
jgi:hypothetical protein